MDIKNWKVPDGDVEYKNSRFQVVKKTVTQPDGTHSDYYVLDRYVSFFSIVIPITPQRQTYLVGQYRVAPEVFSWEFPMGSVYKKDHPVDVAKIELKEETGLTANSYKEIGWFHIAPGHTNQKGYVFVATDLTQGEPQPESGEFLKIKKVPIEQVGEMIGSGEITDAPTIAAYHFYQQHSTK